MNKRALVVEDDATVRELLAAFVESTGKFDVVDSFASAEEVLEVFEPGKYELAIIDIGLIIMSGVDLSYIIRTADPNVILVAVTGHEELTKSVDLSAAGFERWFVKPIGYVDFIKFIQNLP